MSTPPAGTTKKRMFSRNDYLAPLPIPTGRKPCDALNIIWRKNDVFLDIGNYSIGSAVMVMWPGVMVVLAMSFFTRNLNSDFSQGVLILGAVIMSIPILFLIQGLLRDVPLPVRFNRQRREVCVPRDNGEYWIVPWESVTAAATQQSSVSQSGKATMGLLIIGFENPDPHAKEDNKHFSLGFNCGGGTTAMALWECMRSYMEIGPQAVEDQTARFDRSKGIWATYLDDLIKAAKLRGWFVTALWEGFCGLFIFNTLLIDVLERWKLNPPPDLPYPDIIEWSKPLPPEQWVKRSPELEAAIAKRESELATRARDAA
ncbi:mechanosensitive channel protein [Pseudomonas sp. FW306-02-F02-AA]|uniref:Transmembrane protein n=1 Tax=Pseudomonas fluorescens TaxID=294 RepID=A0A0N7GZG0_PSEFL|nr:MULTISPECIES: hypothetical protein [Pseudomonas]ALI00236.1 hypothetical protein AO353_03940 [Pseudomonas fluorescens]PMZ06002.1 mechanosensitive channel protein [Pseudomonas sp. FW306-02-F02-AB]PMZ11766.1 mechanosensitive channel protein [Pseudomonas sp. FW306-02-H06C]PMZ17688.1 mechanosensitive channel protein [Pseudomonas sp. FW306-02-F02-AA]PMZ21308.1 mechanosensitive channel protein [Pseudomonas sp. FW306-02-F08-AA]